MYVIDKASKLRVKVTTSETTSGNATIIKLLDPKDQAIGTLCVADGSDSLRILTFEKNKRNQYKYIGKRCLEIAEKTSMRRGFDGRMPLICQDENAAAFFYKSGFRFSGDNAQEKNAALKKYLEDCDPTKSLPEEYIFLGDMSKNPTHSRSPVQR